MSADIQKEAVFDDRIVQSRPRYAVEKGALSLTNAPFNAIASTQSQQTFNIYVPSENVFVDRALRWSATAYFQMDVTLPTAPTAFAYQTATTGVGNPNYQTGGTTYGIPATFAYDNVLSPGEDIALAPFPLNYMCQTMTATINDTTTVINSQDVLTEVMRLTDYKKNTSQRTCPTMLDRYQANYLGQAPNGAINSPMNGYSEAMNTDEVPNGTWGGLVFTQPNGSVLVGSGSYTDTYTGNTVYYRNGIPVLSGSNSSTPYTSYRLYVAFYSTEKLTLSPFVFADEHEHDTGLFGINNIQLVMNFKSGLALSRVFRTLGDLGSNAIVSGSSITWNSYASSVWSGAVMNVQFLTPSLDVPLPPKSVVPYMEFPRFITQGTSAGSLVAYPQNASIGSTTATVSAYQIQSQTITLPQIPDLLIIYVKPTQVAGSFDPLDPSYADAYLPICSASPAFGGIKNPLSINFDNFSGLLSSHTTEELYAMTHANGLSMSYPQWSGLARSSVMVGGNPSPTYTAGGKPYPGVGTGGLVPTTGGPLILKPSKDITLQPGQAPSLVGNFTLQFNLQVFNPYPFSVNAQLYVITVNSGFFESIRGSSRIIKGVLSEQDIISAPVSSAQTREGLARMVGGRVSMGSLANVIHRAKSAYDATKPSGSGHAMPKGMFGADKDKMAQMAPHMGSGGSRLSARLM